MSGVKITNEQHPRPIANDFDGVSGTDDGDDNFSWDPGITTEIPPGNDPGDVLTWDGDSWEPEPPAVTSREWELWNEGGDPLVKVHGSMGSTETIDPTDGNVHTGTLDADCTVTLSAPSGTAGTLLLWLTQDSTGGRAITWSGSVTVIGTPDTTASVTNQAVAVTVDGGTSWVVAWVGGGSVTVQDEGTPLTTHADTLNFTGAWVTATGSTGTKTIDVPARALDDLTDVTITSPASGDKVRYNGSGWVNSNLHDEPMIASDGTVMLDGLLNPMMHEVAW